MTTRRVSDAHEIRERMRSDYGIVLRRSRHKEDDVRIVLLLRAHGKVESVARGARRVSSKLKSLIEPFSESDIQIFLPGGSVYSKLISGRLISSHLGLRGDYARFSLASQCCETAEILLPYRAPAPDLYDVLRDALVRLESAPDARWEWPLFVVRLFDRMGHGDLLPRILTFLPDERRSKAEAFFRQTVGGGGSFSDLPEADLQRVSGVIQPHLENVLPWRLKSGDLGQSRP